MLVKDKQEIIATHKEMVKIPVLSLINSNLKTEYSWYIINNINIKRLD